MRLCHLPFETAHDFRKDPANEGHPSCSSCTQRGNGYRGAETARAGS